VLASYYAVVPTGGWTTAHNGTYSIVMQPSSGRRFRPDPQLHAGGTIGTFVVNLVPPTATITAVSPNPHLAGVNTINIVFSKAVDRTYPLVAEAFHRQRR